MACSAASAGIEKGIIGWGIYDRCYREFVVEDVKAKELEEAINVRLGLDWTCYDKKGFLIPQPLGKAFVEEMDPR